MTDPSQHLFWITSRSAGAAALVLASLSVGVGLMMSGRLLRGRLADRRPLHEALGMAVLIALAIHALALLGDSYLRATPLDVSVPFASSFRPALTSLGIVSGWAFIGLGLGYYVRGRIGVARWRFLHRFTLLAWAGGLVHGLGEGTDAGRTWFLLLVAVTAAPAVLALSARCYDAVAARYPALGT
jgi:methionine sulfoxide reductase heme-binding subunit